MKKIIVILTILLETICINSFASNLPKQTKYANFSGAISGRETGKEDTLTVIYSDAFVLFGETRLNIPIKTDNTFSFKLPTGDYPGNILLGIKGYPYILLNTFYEQGDSVHLSFDLKAKNPISKISGSNSSKYELLDSLNLEYDRFIESKIKGTAGMRNLSDIQYDYQKLYRFFSTGYSKMLNTLDEYKTSIKPDTYNYILATYTSLYLGAWPLEIKGAVARAKTPAQKKELITVYNKYKFPDFNADNELISFNDYYIQYLLESVRTALFVNGLGEGYSYQSMYNYLRNNFEGKLRESLLTYFLIDYKSSLHVKKYDPLQFDKCLVDAFDLVKNSYLKENLSTKFKLQGGSEVFNFSMSDTSGKTVTLADLKGNVVLIDVWGEGCSGCAIFHRMFKNEIYPAIKHHSDFKVVSISVDKTAKGWLRGISSGKYTDNHHINLFTGGLGMNHPFVKYYNFNVIPFIILIDRNGKLFSKIDLGLSADEVIELINQALKKTKA